MSAGLSLADGFDLLGLGLRDVWWHYVGLGGDDAPARLGDRIAGAVASTRAEHDVVAQALNELFIDQGLGTFPVAYSSDPAAPE